MPVDVETQLRTLGRLLEREVAPIEADEVLGASTMLELEPAIEPRGERHRSRFVVAAALAAAAAAVIAVMVTLRDDTRPGEQLDASEAAAAEELLVPPADLAGLAVTRAAHDQTAPGVIRAAVRTPSGEIIGITIYSKTTIGGGTGGQKTIGGRTVAVSKSSVNDFWSYDLFRDCYRFRITMSDGLETPDPFAYTTPSEIETFFQQLTITDATGATGGDGERVTIELPPGWESLGAATVSDRYILRFTADVDTQQDVEFELDQRPATGVGVFLADPGRSNPQPITVWGRPAWLTFSTGGWTTLVFDDHGTAVALGTRGLYQPFDARTDGLDQQQLVDFADALERRPWGETSALLAGTNPTQTPVSELFPELEQPVPAGCAVSLEIV